MVLTTSLVIVMPALFAGMIVPRDGWPMMAVSAALAVALSVALAAAAAAVWKRRVQSRDVVFADLLLWGWLRRCWTERRLSQARDLYDTARKAGPNVSIEQLTGLSRLLEARDTYTHGHGQRVARHAGRIARAMRLPPAEVARIRSAAAVHDIGKLYTPREILNNPGRLTDAEFAVIKRHPVDGAEMLASVGSSEMTAIVRYHHERIDGRGYPDGLSGPDIPLGARIIAVADTFDAITSSRAYRRAATQKQALDILAKEAGSQLDAVAVAAFRRRYAARRPVAWVALAMAIPQRIFAGVQAASLGFGASTGGAASILPALGAAGLLTFSPALNGGVFGQVHSSPAALTTEQMSSPAASATAAPPLGATRTAGTIPLGRHHHARSRSVGASPGAPASGGATAGTPTALHNEQRAAGHGPATPAPGPVPPPPGTPSTPAPAPPTGGAPGIPTPPVAPPVSVPGVETPATRITVPSTPVPGVSSPTVETPAVNVPGVG
jgi:putative nucleotidyltransferase with HDIG domain